MFLNVLLDSRMSDEAGFGHPTEERTLRALHTLQALLLSSSDKLVRLLLDLCSGMHHSLSIFSRSLFQLYKNLPAIGHCVSVTVSALQGWESRDLRKTSLSTLLALTGMKPADIAAFTGESNTLLYVY